MPRTPTVERVARRVTRQCPTTAGYQGGRGDEVGGKGCGILQGVAPPTRLDMQQREVLRELKEAHQLRALVSNVSGVVQICLWRGNELGGGGGIRKAVDLAAVSNEPSSRLHGARQPRAQAERDWAEPACQSVDRKGKGGVSPPPLAMR